VENKTRSETGNEMTPPRTRASEETAEFENRRNNEEAAMKQTEESELHMAQRRAQAMLMEGLRAELEATKRAAAEKELQWQNALATLTSKLAAKENPPETTTENEDNTNLHQGDSLRSLATTLAAGHRELMKEVAELKRQVTASCSKPPSQDPQDQVDEVKQQTASSTSEMSERPTKPKTSRRFQTRKGDGDPSSDGDGSDSHERRRETNSKNGRRERRAQRNRRRDSRQYYDDDSDSSQELSTRAKLEIYKATLKNVSVKGANDSMFPTARAAWSRLRRQHPLPWAKACGALPHAFTGHAAAVYEIVANLPEMTDNDETLLWEELTKRLFNKEQVTLKRSTFDNLRQLPKETPLEFAARLRELATSLPEHVQPTTLCSRFLSGLNSSALREKVTVADNGNFDELVGKTVRVAQASQRETVAAVDERPSRLYEKLPQGSGSKDSPIGPSETQLPIKRFASVKCHNCQMYGHVARGRYPCSRPPEVVQTLAGNE
jgi:Retrotransposon gag protein